MIHVQLSRPEPVRLGGEGGAERFDRARALRFNRRQLLDSSATVNSNVTNYINGYMATIGIGTPATNYGVLV